MQLSSEVLPPCSLLLLGFLGGSGWGDEIKPFPNERQALLARETFHSPVVATARVLNLLQMWKLLEALLAYCLVVLHKVLFRAR